MAAERKTEQQGSFERRNRQYQNVVKKVTDKGWIAMMLTTVAVTECADSFWRAKT